MKRIIATVAAVAALASCSPKEGTGILDFHPRREVKTVLKEAKTDNNAVTILHFSDLHGSRENLERIASFYDAYDDLIDIAVHSGDGVICYTDNPNEWDNVPAARKIWNTIGNHDCWKCHLVWAETDYPYDAPEEDVWYTTMVGKDAAHPFIESWGVTRPEGADVPASPRHFACYYYKDLPKAGIRVIALDPLHYYAGNAQDLWFAEMLADALQKNLQVLVVQHYTPEKGLDFLPCAFSPEGEGRGAVENADVPQIEAMRDAAFCRTDEFIAAGGQFICWLSGHTHNDAIGYPAEHLKQLQIIVEKAGERDGYMQEPRVVGTPSQDAFNLVTVNPKSKTLVIDRIGSNCDSKGRSKQNLVYDYLNHRIISAK